MTRYRTIGRLAVGTTPGYNALTMILFVFILFIILVRTLIHVVGASIVTSPSYVGLELARRSAIHRSLTA